MREIKFENETIQVVNVTGYNDGYYWDLNAEIIFRGEIYRLFDSGSCSGYIPCCCGITKCEFNRLYGAKQEFIDDDDWEVTEYRIGYLVNQFVNSGAKETWEQFDDTFGDYQIHVDGKEVVEES